MKRDMDVVRELLLEIEKHPELDRKSWCRFGPGDLGITEENQESREYHIGLLIEAGFILGQMPMDGPMISGLTWQGHEFLSDVRDPKIWKLTKAGAKKAGVTGLSLIWELAKGYGKQKAQSMGLPIP